MQSPVEKTIVGKTEIHWRYTDESKKHVEINFFAIPPAIRGKGMGKRAAQAFLRSLQASGIHTVELFAADTGEGRTNHFWEAVGFDYRYETFEEGDEQKLGTQEFYTMQIGLGEHKTNKISRETWMQSYEEAA